MGEPGVSSLDEGGARAHARAYARARGTLVHRVLESLDMTRAANVRDEDVEHAARELGMRLRAADRAEIVRLVRSARPPRALFERISAAMEVHREHPFAFVLGVGPNGQPPGTLITGAIDVLARERGAPGERGKPGGRALLIDYKTDSVPRGAGAEELEELVERDYSLQRGIYAIALLREGAEEVEIVHWFLESAEGCVSARYRARDRVRLEDQLCERLRRALERGFAPSEEPHRALCETCPGRGTLCSWGEQETLREHPVPGGPANAVPRAA